MAGYGKGLLHDWYPLSMHQFSYWWRASQNKVFMSYLSSDICKHIVRSLYNSLIYRQLLTSYHIIVIGCTQNLFLSVEGTSHYMFIHFSYISLLYIC